MKNTKTLAFQRAFYDIPGPIAIAHRGGNLAGAKKENSMKAFRSAVKQGFVYIETDVVVSSDGVVLTFHGSRSRQNRKKNGLPLRRDIQTMSYKQIKRDVRIGEEPIPTLREVLTAFPNCRFFIDAKTNEAIEPLANLIKTLKVQDRVSIGCFSRKRTMAVAELLGGHESVATSHALFGAINMLGLKLAFTRTYLSSSGALSLQVPSQLVTKKIAKRANELGIALIVWPSKPSRDNQRYIDTAIDLGVHGIMSDHTLLLKERILAKDPSNKSIISP